MSDCFGITGIGANPLGLYGLGTGSYSSLPTSLSMMGGMPPMMSGLGMTGMGMTGLTGMDPMTSSMGMGAMGGMYYPTFMAQMQQMQRDAEKAQLQHTGEMHDLTVQNGVNASQTDFDAIISKLMVDGGIQKYLKSLNDKVTEGDQDGICKVYDQLKSTIENQYRDEFKKRNVKDIPATINYMIKCLYTNAYTVPGRNPASLDNDVKRYGETSFMHGFWSNFHGKDYHKRSSEETLAYINGTPIDNYAGKKRMENYGAKTESCLEPVAALAAGYGAGLAGAGIAAAWNPFGILNKTVKDPKTGKVVLDKAGNVMKKCAISWKGARNFAGVVSLIALGGDILWQMSR